MRMRKGVRTVIINLHDSIFARRASYVLDTSVVDSSAQITPRYHNQMLLFVWGGGGWVRECHRGAPVSDVIARACADRGRRASHSHSSPTLVLFPSLTTLAFQPP